MYRNFRNSYRIRVWSIILAICLLFQIVAPTAAYALTGGPSQPEVNSFTPIGTSDMVDPFSGNFNYNIPLMDVGGYPLNLAYDGAPNMDTESSWVGLGWNINPGVINRNMRGIPDDFKGTDRITQEYNMRPNWTFGTSIGIGGEFFGFDPGATGGLTGGASFNFGISYNNYNGIAISSGASISLDMAVGASNTGLGLSANNSSSGGLSVSPSLSFSAVHEGEKGKDKFGTSIGTSYNSRQGLSALTVSASVSGGTEKDATRDAKAYTKYGGGASTSGSINFMNNTYVPNLDMPRITSAMSGSFKLGGALFGGDIDGTFSGFFSKQELLYNSKAFPAYGFMYEEDGAPQSDVMLDFNRENEQSFTRTLPNIHTTNHSYDLFSISGQGVSGMFRPFRSEVGYVHNNEVTDVNSGGVVSIEIGPGNIADVGFSEGVATTLSNSGNWNSSNPAKTKLSYKSKSVNSLYEPYYFKHTGEITVDEEMQEGTNLLFDNSGGFEAVRIGAFSAGYYHSTLAEYVKKDGSTIPMTLGSNQRNSILGRAKRNQVITSLTKDEASNYGIQKYTNPNAKSHHLSEMTVLQNDGSRYVYGIPAYNKVKKDVSFNVSKRPKSVNDVDGFVYYLSGDNSTGNKLGRDNYFNRTTLPAYAHSYLLTSVLSHDYVDSDGVTGPSNDDYGNYTKFEYGVNNAPDIPNYKWRAPFNFREANYSEGLKVDQGDQRGSYVYGEKEIWYMKKIETKTHVAIFTVSDRNDGYGVANEEGGLGGAPMKKLDKISLYARPDYYLSNGNVNPSAVPIKEVHFRYSYELCPKVPNNNGAAYDHDNDASTPSIENESGKLTLKRVFFTYGNSFKGELSDYQFVYADPNHDGIMEANYSYNLKNVNAWGGYKLNPVGAGYAPSAGLLTSEYPYIEQDDPLQDEYANAWALTSVLLPSGGRIDIDLEAKDYTHVQDKKAMQMFKILGCDDDGDGSNLSSELYSGNNPNSYLYFELPAGFQQGDNVELFSALERNESIYYRFLIDLTNSFIDSDDGSHEYVEGYLHRSLIIDKGIEAGANPTYGFIKLSETSVNDGSGTGAHPISKSAWQFARMNAPRKAFDQPDPQEGSPLSDVAMALASQVTNIAELFTGANGLLKTKGYGKKFIPNKSWIRLNHPGKGKIGGGYRVKSVKMYDNWEFMSDDHSSDPVNGSDGFYSGFQYGQEYIYEMEDGSSSGVATFEPMGSKDNPIIQPVAFTAEHLLAPDDKHYQETPFGMSFYPAPSVGHRRVVIKNLQYGEDDIIVDGILQDDELTVKRNATGKIVHEFYTCMDYPVRVDRTELFAREKKTGLGGQLLKLSVKNYAVASQGFVIETNDMHGKPKTQRVYPEGENTDYISGVTYVYDHNFATTPPGGTLFQSFIGNATKLNNYVNVITPQGKLKTKQIGIDFDMINDFGESTSDMTDIKVDFNTAAFLASILPFIVPTVWPTYAKQKTRYRYASTTKVINRFGILREVIAHDLGASVSTRNLAWDSETGEVLLTETTNEYSDKVYNLNYPAHWSYSGMGQAYQNIGAIAKVTVNAGVITGFSGSSSVSLDQMFEPGDEVAIASGKYWIHHDGVNYILIDATTSLPLTGLTGTYELKIIRSGHRNMQALSIGTIALLTNPIAGLNNGANIPLLVKNSADDIDEVIQTSATEYSDNWPMENCDCNFDANAPYNPYVYNAKGTWRSLKSHLYLHKRKQSSTQVNRTDGIFELFNPFWRYFSGDWGQNTNNWTWTSEVTKYSPYGFELENKDRLDRYSAAQYDYNNNLPVAVANNAKYRQIGFDSFEEYHFDNCEKDHFSFESSVSSITDANGDGIDDVTGNGITDQVSHTGRKSITVGPNSSVKLGKKLDECPL